MIPARFTVEYPQRCLDLLEALEPIAKQRRLIGSFSLLAASGIFTIPYSRLREDDHPLLERHRFPSFYDALQGVSRQKFTHAVFWQGTGAGDWRSSCIVSSPNDTFSWRDKQGSHPMAVTSVNMIGKCKVRDVLRVVRNALAHGNIVYLDEKGTETLYAEVRYLAFLTRHEDPKTPPPRTYDLIATTEENFLRFVKCWAKWLAEPPADDRLLFRDAAD